MYSVGRRVKGITSRLIFESQFDARYQRNPWGDTRSDARARTRTGWRPGRLTDGWTLLPTEAVCEPSGEL